MDKAQEIAQRIAYMMKGNGVSSIDVSFRDKFGIVYPLVLSARSENGNGELENLEVFTLHVTMTADTNFGKTNLLEITKYEKDWHLLEISVKDVLGY